MDYYNQQPPQQPQAPQQTNEQMHYQYHTLFQQAPPPPPPESNDSSEKSVFNIALKGVALVVGLFIIGYLGGALKNIEKIDNLQMNNAYQTTDTTVSVPDQTTSTTLPEDTTVPSTAEYEKESTTEAITKPTTTKPTTTEATTILDTAPETKEEIVELFNNSANKVKNNASKITRLHDRRRHDEELSDYPAVWNTVGRALINSWLVDHDTPVVYDERDLMIANFPVKGETWSSKLKAEDVAAAYCEEVDGYYEIEIKLAYCVDPEENQGPLAVMEEVNTELVQEFVDIVKDCSVEYYDCVIRCSIEKETGNLMLIRYVQPMVLHLTTQRFTTLTGVFAMTFDSEFLIEY